MQEECEDYSLLDYNEGCCLSCSDSHEGCLCFDCKCKKCYWYIPPGDYDGEKGKCGLVKDNHYTIPFSKDLYKIHFDLNKLIMKPMGWLNEEVKKIDPRDLSFFSLNIIKESGLDPKLIEDIINNIKNGNRN